MTQKSLEQERKDRLALLFRTASERNIGSIMLCEGEHLLGIKRIIARLAQILDPRHFHALRTTGRDFYRPGMPFLSPYWKNLPRFGDLVVYEHGYYSRLVRFRESGDAGKKTVNQIIQQINDFERTLNDNHYRVFKFNFTRPLERLENDYKKRIKKTELRETLKKRYKELIHSYSSQKKFYTEIRAKTDTPHAPWFEPPSDRNSRLEAAVFDYLIAKMEENLEINSMAAVRSFDAAMDRVREIRRTGNAPA